MTTEIVSEIYECPLCAERDYILVIDGSIYCLSCGYDGSNSEDFIVL